MLYKFHQKTLFFCHLTFYFKQFDLHTVFTPPNRQYITPPPLPLPYNVDAFVDQGFHPETKTSSIFYSCKSHIHMLYSFSQ